MNRFCKYTYSVFILLFCYCTETETLQKRLPSNNSIAQYLECGIRELDSSSITYTTWCPLPETSIHTIYTVTSPPLFEPTFSYLTKEDKVTLFKSNLQEYVSENINVSIFEELEISQRVFVKFTIDTIGSINQVLVRSQFPKIEIEVTRLINELPALVPAYHNKKRTDITHTFPIMYRKNDF